MASIFNIGVSALLAQQRALAVTANNIANASTPGYSRQRVEFSERPADRIGTFFIGSGVDVGGIRRMSDELASAQMRGASSAFHRAEAFASLASVVENLLADEELGLAATLQSFANALQDVANDPASTSARQAFLSEARTLVARFESIDDRLTALEGEVARRQDVAATEISSLGASLAELNQRILTTSSPSGPPSDLLDQRDKLLERLAELVDIDAVTQADGSTSVFIGSGQALVLGGTSMELGTVPGRFDPHHPELVLRSGGSDVVVTQFLAGGELGALVDFRREMLSPTRAAIGQIAVGLVSAANAAHANGMDLHGDLGQALFAIAPPAALGAATNTGGTEPSVTIADVGALAPRSYRLHYDGADYRILDATSGAEIPVTGTGSAADPLVFDGLEVAFAAPPAAGDAFEIRAVESAVSGLALLVENSDRVAAAAPVRTRAVLGNVGDVSVELVAIDDPADPDLLATTTIEFIDATTYQINGAGAYAYTPGDEIVVNGARVVLTGAPAAGDSFVIESNAGGIGDNRNALAMIDALAAGILDGGTTTLQGAVGRTVAQVGTLSAETQRRRDAQAALLDQSRARLDSLRGVNLDEEAANMMRTEQMYHAAAQTIAVAGTLFDSLLAALRR